MVELGGLEGSWGGMDGRMFDWVVWLVAVRASYTC